MHYGLPLDALALTKAHRKVEGNHRAAAWRILLDHVPASRQLVVVTTSSGGGAIESLRRPNRVVISATKRVRGYELETGKLLWECAGLSRNVVSSPVAGEGMRRAASPGSTMSRGSATASALIVSIIQSVRSRPVRITKKSGSRGPHSR